MLLLHPFNYSLPATTTIADAVRNRFIERSPRKVEIYAEQLDLSRANHDPGHENWTNTFLRDRYTKTRPDIILALSEALPYVAKHRGAFLPDTPVVFAAVSPATLADAKAPPDVTGVLLDTAAHLNNALALAERLQPDTRRLYVIAGNAPVDRRWQATARRVIEGRERKFETNYMFGESYESLLEEVARIPKDAIVIPLTFAEDVTGKAFVSVEVREAIVQRSAAPVYSTYYSSPLGRGIVGASSETYESMGAAAADMALEILSGSDPATIPPRANPETSFRVDYRALQRFALSESNLPAGTTVLFKSPTIWDEHRGFVLAAIGVIALQSAFAGALLLERRSRRRAEVEAALQRREIAHLTRVSVLGELSGAIAHEINQPLSAILSNAQAALQLLARSSPDIDEVRGALQDIVQEDNRASQVIQRLKTLLKKGEATHEPIDLNEIVESTTALLNSELIGRGVRIQTALASDLPLTSGDPIQLQQVLINFIVNGIEAMATTPDGQRQIAIATRTGRHGCAELVVRDRGTGIAGMEKDKVFKPFFTTKQNGLGLGLTICSTIIEAHGGELSLTNTAGGGAEARFSLPAQEMQVAAQ